MEDMKIYNWQELRFQDMSSRDSYYSASDGCTLHEDSALYAILGVDPKESYITLHFHSSRSSYSYHPRIQQDSQQIVQIALFRRVLDLPEHMRNRIPSRIADIKISSRELAKIIDFKMTENNNYYYHSDQLNCMLTFQMPFGSIFYVYSNLKVLENAKKFVVTSTEKYKVYGKELLLDPLLHQFRIQNYHYGTPIYRGDLNYLSSLHNFISDQQNIAYCISAFLQRNDNFVNIQPKGVTKLHDKLKPFYAELCVTHPKLMSLYKTLICNSGKSINRVKVSSVVNETLGGVSTKDEFVVALDTIITNYDAAHAEEKNRYSHYNLETIVTELPTYAAKRKVALKTQATGAFNKVMQDMDFLSIEPEKYPVTYEAITSGKITLSTFFRKTESYFTFNTIWDLWEEMLTKYPEITVELAGTVKGRTTYEKDLMSYFYFVLHALPEYLEKQTGKKWICQPKLVNSARELDPPKNDDDRGVRKTRSALTPIVDNVKNTVVVPYASLAISGGRGTTYCYSLNYNVLQRGLSINGDVCMSDIESRLNGKDDYGLMFYTLTGSAQGRGYPSFLIIFERLKKGTKVHFHRVHPMRSKDGDYNPISQWIKGCFKWMIGNVPFEKIKVSQGDLAFIECEKAASKFNSEDVQMVDEYDSHAFAEPVAFVKPAKDKSNILGYIKIEKTTTLNHPEHEKRIMQPGVYELRQARSWEANPKGVWSLRID